MKPVLRRSTRTPGTTEDSVLGITELRAELDRLDRRIVSLLARRLRVARTIGRRKREEGAPVLDPAQEAAVIRRAAVRARERGLAEEPVRRIFWQVVGISRNGQRKAPR